MEMNTLIKSIKSDFSNHNGKGFINGIFKYYSNQSLRLIINYRIGNYTLAKKNIFCSIIRIWLKRRQMRKYHCDISFNAIIGQNIKFPHPISIVIGTNSIIEDDVTIWQGVTIGSKGNIEKLYPHIESKVKIFANSIVVGPIRVGESSIIGALKVLSKNLPKQSKY